MEHGVEPITRLIIQLAFILATAKLFGEVFQRWFKMPPVLGELGAGIVIGPFALGGIDIPWIGALFAQTNNLVHGVESVAMPIPDALWSIAQIGSIVLLFVAGLETNLGQFLKYAKSASIVAVGGVVLPFMLGIFLTVWFGFADGLTDVRALFVGVVMTATSIGITVRVMGDLNRLGTPEGVTILGAAVLDDVVGILMLTVVIGISSTGEFAASSVGITVVKTFGFWIALTCIGLLLSRHISNFLDKFKVAGATLVLSLAIAFLAAALSKSVGLEFIIGAFSIGLALSGTELAHRLESQLSAVYAVLVPIFFVVMGMMVDFGSMGEVWQFGLVISMAAVIGKVGGSGLPAFFAGFNRLGAIRIGVGMLPRGEVALVMGGIGMSAGLLDPGLYGVAILMTIITTAIAPPMLALLFRSDVSGVRTESVT